MSRLRAIWVVPGWTLLLLLGLLLGAGIFLIYAGAMPVQTTRVPRMRVLVDPGHGGIDSGCSWGQVYEKDLTLELALLLKNRLEHAGVPALLTRATDRDLDPLEPTLRGRHRRDLQARARVAREAQVDALVSLHVNAATGGNLSGAMVFYQPQHPESRRLAAHILEELARILPGNQNAILPGDFYILRQVPYPAVLVEAGFITGSADRALLTSSHGREKIAEATAAGIQAYAQGLSTPAVEDRPSAAPVIEWGAFDRLEPHGEACGPSS